MWIHVQRVPRAHINPPRPISIAVTLMFVVLALVKPILSQGGEADMSVVPTNIDFDWFELPVLALVYVTNPLHLWFWVLGLTGFLFLIPWLPPKRRGAAKEQTSITFHPDHKAVTARFGETLLDAGLRQDINLPYECRNGGCGMCKCTVLAGKVDPGLYQPSALSAEELAQARCCCAAPPPSMTRKSSTRPLRRSRRSRSIGPASSSWRSSPTTSCAFSSNCLKDSISGSRPASTSMSFSTMASGAPSRLPTRRMRRSSSNSRSA
jgi:ferredoxin